MARNLLSLTTNPNREFDDDINDLETESTQDKNSPPSTLLLCSSSSDESLLDSSSKLRRHTYQKACRANNYTILPTIIYNSHSDPSINLSTTNFLPILLRHQLYQYHPTHDIVNVTLFATNP